MAGIFTSYLLFTEVHTHNLYSLKLYAVYKHTHMKTTATMAGLTNILTLLLSLLNSCKPNWNGLYIMYKYG